MALFEVLLVQVNGGVLPELAPSGLHLKLQSSRYCQVEQNLPVLRKDSAG